MAARHGAAAPSFTGHARFSRPEDRRRSNGEELTAPLIFINVGGRARVPDLPGVRDVATLNNSTSSQLEALPRHLVVVGGSYIGLEFAQMYRRFGAEVTVVEKSPRLIAREDEDVSDAMREILEGEGISVRLDAECITFEARGNDVAVGLHCNDGPKEAVGSHVLLAVGRQPNTDDLGLEAAGITTDKNGNIIVDDASPPTSMASGRSAIATAAALSPTPPTTISRSSPPTCSTARTARSATASPATRSTSIRRSAASA